MQEKFERGFAKEEMEITVLLKDGCKGAAIPEKKWLIPSAEFLAMLDNRSGEMIKEEGRLEWLIKDNPDRKGWGFDFKQYGIYRLLVRKCVPKELDSYQITSLNNTYMVIRILETDVQDDKLSEYKEYLSRPVVIDTPYGLFVLDRSFSWFESEATLGGYDATVFLETDEENGDTAEGARKVFLETAEHFEEFDKKNKEYAVENLLELANEWQDSEEGEHEPITRETFMERIEISEMTVSPQGCISLFYSDGDMFWGHAIEITIESDGTYSDADIAG